LEARLLLWKPDIENRDGPKYLAVVSSLAADIRSGKLRPGFRLPSQRKLAKSLNVDVTTITRAFNEARRLGLIEANAGRGSFIRASQTFSHTNIAAHEPRVVNLSNNSPPPPADLDLADLIRTGMTSVLTAPTALRPLDYQDSAGAPNDRLEGARWLSARLGNLALSRVLVVGGAQVALSAILSTLLAPGDKLGTPALTYPGLRAATVQHGAELVPIAIDDDGIIPAAFQECCEREKLAALYCVPTMHNPTTATMPEERRVEVAKIAERFQVTIIEDDAYGALPSRAPPPIAALAPHITWHVASLSKCVTPALRIAYVVTPNLSQTLRLTGEVRAISMMAPPLMASLVSRWNAEGVLQAIVEAIRAESAARQALARAALRDFDMRGHPEGHNVWLRLPDNWQRSDFRTYAMQSGIAVVTSDAFSVGPQPEAIRLSLGSTKDRGKLEKALVLLATLLSQKGDIVWTQS
jgi:DNA-binding transcriptional MocR family regulator